MDPRTRQSVMACQLHRHQAYELLLSNDHSMGRLEGLRSVAAIGSNVFLLTSPASQHLASEPMRSAAVA